MADLMLEFPEEGELGPLIPVGRVEWDCTPVAFETPGQAINVLSCAVSQMVTAPVTQSVVVQTPAGNVPVTTTVQVPVMTTVNIPPTLVPIPTQPCGCGCH